MSMREDCLVFYEIDGANRNTGVDAVFLVKAVHNWTAAEDWGCSCLKYNHYQS